MIKATFDDSKFRARVAGMLKGAPKAREEGVKALARHLVYTLVNTKHRDTNRYVNGWALAGREAGLGDMPVRPLRDPKWFEQYGKVLANQLQFWKTKCEVLQHENPARFADEHDLSTREAKKNLRIAQREWDRYTSRETNAIIVLNLFRSGGKPATVRFKVYGGRGVTHPAAERTVVVLHNLEAHAAIVESRFGVARHALQQLRSFGGASNGYQRAGKLLVDKLAEAWKRAG